MSRAVLAAFFLSALPASASPPTGKLEHRILYLRRDGGVYKKGLTDNSAENESDLIAVNEIQLPGYDGTDEDWAYIMSCSRRIWGPYAIDVVDVEPDPGTPYIESVVVGGSAVLIGRDGTVLGMASASAECTVLERGVNFAYAKPEGLGVIRLSPKTICEVVAQETGHDLGMDHEYYAPDPMSYLDYFGDRSFQDYDAQCGEFDNPRPCACGTSTQNSHQWLLAVLGPADDVPPTAMLTAPTAGEHVLPRFRIEAVAEDDVRIDRVEFLVDGASIGRDETGSAGVYSTEAPTSVHAGSHSLTMRAVDGDENAVETTIDVTVDPECGETVACAAGRECVIDICLAGLGASCGKASDCAAGTCYALSQNERVCTQDCSLDDPASCPSGFVCQELELTTPKCLQGEEGGCACVLPGRRRDQGLGATAVGLIAIAWVAQRRRR